MDVIRSVFVERLKGALKGREHKGHKASQAASVAVVLRSIDDTHTEVLLIERTRREDDPWSGQMAFPGGRIEGQESPFDAALREAKEEVGIDLDESKARFFGRLDDTKAMARGKRLDFVIKPHVFELLNGRPPLQLQHDEVASTVWAPIEQMQSGVLDGTIPWNVPGVGSANLPCFHVQGKVVWGLTHRMLRSLFEVAGPTQKA